MYQFTVETNSGKKVLKFNTLKEAKKEYDKYLNYEKEYLTLSPIVKSAEEK